VRIGLITHDYERTGGHSRYVVELARRFARDHEVHVFANTFGEPLPAGARAHQIPAIRRTALTTILSFAASRPGSGVALDIVHGQGVSGAPANVVTAHICNARWLEARRRPDGHASYRDRLFAAAIVPLERRLFARADTRAIAVSQVVARDLVECYQRTAPIDVIPHGVDLEQFNPERTASLRQAARRAYGVENRAFVVLFVGDLRKGADVLVEAVARVPRMTAVLVSRSDPSAIRSRAAQLGCADRVIVSGLMRSIERAYAAADAFVLPTPYDAFGMVITEAMACGLPVVTTDRAGAAELITHGVDGFVLTDPRDAGPLIRAIETLAGDEPGRFRIGQAAARKAATLTWDHVADQTMRVYEQVIGKTTTGAAA
jgi:UDP-glucose:(heptosyl)LPS alpha-1,3-glucosyltransferase